MVRNPIFRLAGILAICAAMAACKGKDDKATEADKAAEGTKKAGEETAKKPAKAAEKPWKTFTDEDKRFSVKSPLDKPDTQDSTLGDRTVKAYSFEMKRNRVLGLVMPMTVTGTHEIDRAATLESFARGSVGGMGAKIDNYKTQVVDGLEVADFEFEGQTQGYAMKGTGRAYVTGKRTFLLAAGLTIGEATLIERNMAARFFESLEVLKREKIEAKPAEKKPEDKPSTQWTTFTDDKKRFSVDSPVAKPGKREETLGDRVVDAYSFEMERNRLLGLVMAMNVTGNQKIDPLATLESFAKGAIEGMGSKVSDYKVETVDGRKVAGFGFAGETQGHATSGKGRAYVTGERTFLFLATISIGKPTESDSALAKRFFESLKLLPAKPDAPKAP